MRTKHEVVAYVSAGMSVYGSPEVQDHQIARILGKVGAAVVPD